MSDKDYVKLNTQNFGRASCRCAREQRSRSRSQEKVSKSASAYEVNRRAAVCILEERTIKIKSYMLEEFTR